MRKRFITIFISFLILLVVLPSVNSIAKENTSSLSASVYYTLEQDTNIYVNRILVGDLHAGIRVLIIYPDVPSIYVAVRIGTTAFYALAADLPSLPTATSKGAATATKTPTPSKTSTASKTPTVSKTPTTITHTSTVTKTPTSSRTPTLTPSATSCFDC